VSLLPRHWEWLARQPSGASAAIRRLVDKARKANPDDERTRLAIEAVSRFLSAMAGNLPGYEEATRALFGRNREGFDELIRAWPPDICLHVQRLAGDFQARPADAGGFDQPEAQAAAEQRASRLAPPVGTI
jgi:hypothetical protein